MRRRFRSSNSSETRKEVSQSVGVSISECGIGHESASLPGRIRVGPPARPRQLVTFRGITQGEGGGGRVARNKSGPAAARFPRRKSPTTLMKLKLGGGFEYAMIFAFINLPQAHAKEFVSKHRAVHQTCPKDMQAWKSIFPARLPLCSPA